MPDSVCRGVSVEFGLVYKGFSGWKSLIGSMMQFASLSHTPEASARWAIWQLHLPLEHQIGSMFVREIAERCILAGDHIHNKLLHPSVVALDDGRVISSSHLETVVRYKYRKIGTPDILRSRQNKQATRCLEE